jgi:hypothetical protein
VVGDYFDTFKFKCKKCGKIRWVRAHPNQIEWTHEAIVKAEHDLNIYEGFILWHTAEIQKAWGLHGLALGRKNDLTWGNANLASAEILDTPSLRMEAIMSYLREKRGSDG